MTLHADQQMHDYEHEVLIMFAGLLVPSKVADGKHKI